MNINALIKNATRKCEKYHIRYGQALMNALHDVDKDLHDSIIGSEYDCFYDNEKINNFIEFIKEINIK